RLALGLFYSEALILEHLEDVDVARIAIDAAIGGINAGGMTSVGDGLLKAQDELYLNGLVGRSGHIILLTDGRENTEPDIVEIWPLLLGNNTRLDVVAIGDDAQIELLQRVARDTGGDLYYAPDPSSGTLASEMASIYRAIAEGVRGQHRVYSSRNVTAGNWTIHESFNIDQAVEGTVVFSYKAQSSQNMALPLLEIPDTTTVVPTWMSENPISGEEYYYGHFVWHLENPQSGQYVFDFAGSGEIEYLFESGVRGQVSIQLSKNIGIPVKQYGEKVPILVSLIDRDPIVGANVIAEISASTNYKDRQSWMLRLYDDGQHSDGQANDGLYGNLFTQTTGSGLDIGNQTGITFTLNVKSKGSSSITGNFTREAAVAFHLVKPPDWDLDADGLPDIWELEYGLDFSSAIGDNGWSGDPDHDSLQNYRELNKGTSPIRADTDFGGEIDSSELLNGRDPLFNEDDYFYDSTKGVARIPQCSAIPGDGNVTVFYSLPGDVSGMAFEILVKLDTGPYMLLVAGLSADMSPYIHLTSNNQLYYYQVVAEAAGGAISAPSGSEEAVSRSLAVPKPYGFISINKGERVTDNLDVVLDIYTHPDYVKDWRIANNYRFEGVPWQTPPSAVTTESCVSCLTEYPWELGGYGIQLVYLQVRNDDNVIKTAFDAIRVLQTTTTATIATTTSTPPTTSSSTTSSTSIPPPSPDLSPYLLVGFGAVVVIVVIIIYRRRIPPDSSVLEEISVQR
ncbi:MAG: choice-of-anchor X domain-containing protein, partial [Candidatus Thorarchaeota archaeon]